jgi:hypothetical protein
MSKTKEFFAVFQQICNVVTAKDYVLLFFAIRGIYFVLFRLCKLTTQLYFWPLPFLNSMIKESRVFPLVLQIRLSCF